MKFVSKENLELFAAKLKEQGGSSKASEIDTESATAGQLLGTDGNGNTEWESPMTDSDVDMLFIEKGTILKMNLDGTERQYRVLKKVGGSVVEVLGMFNSSSTYKYNSSSTLAVFSDGDSYQKYEGSTVDSYLNETFYNTFTTAAKEAIVDKAVVQDVWATNASTGDDVYATAWGNHNLSRYNATLNVGNRHVYLPSLPDIIDYLEATTSMTQSDTTLTQANMLKMFWNDTSSHSGVILWLLSAAKDNVGCNAVAGQYGDIGYYSVQTQTSMYVRPAFQIDLSKITYTEV